MNMDIGFMTSSSHCFYVKVEAVNIYNHLADTNQLSIIRGGGLLLKQAIDDISKEFFSNEGSSKSPQDEKVISSGASQGIFNAGDTNPAAKICDWLNQHLQYKHFTFVVDAVEANNFKQAKEKLIALGRFRQMRQLSESPDYENEQSQNINGNPAVGASDFGAIRAATELVHIQEDNKQGALIDLVRAEYGKEQRTGLYAKELSGQKDNNNASNSSAKFGVTHSLHALADCKAMGNLHNKIAVIYFDGNGFGKIQENSVKCDRDQKAFDENMKNYRSLFLQELLCLYLEAGESNRRYFYQNPSKKNGGRVEFQARLETLLWGGDEMILVVPAWLGMDVLHLFYKFSAGWHFRGEPLTHAGGIVFCHYKTPILRATELARRLADKVKEHDNGRENNYYDYMVLESVDFPTTSLNKHFLKTYGLFPQQMRMFLPALNLREAMLPGDAENREAQQGSGPEFSKVSEETKQAWEWEKLQIEIKQLLPLLPRTQFYSLVKTVRRKLIDLESKIHEITSKENLAIEGGDIISEDAAAVIFEHANQCVAEYKHQLQQFWRFTLPGVKEKYEEIAGTMLVTGLSRGETLGDNTKEQFVEHLLQKNKAFSMFLHHYWQYLHFLELWDYLVPELRENGEQKSLEQGIAQHAE